MLAAAISPVPTGTMEKKAGSRLFGEMPRTLVEPSRFAGFEQFIRTLLPRWRTLVIRDVPQDLGRFDSDS
ncbi:MAG: hypothetical protein QM755_10880 [Luteolibacter sp.]